MKSVFLVEKKNIVLIIMRPGGHFVGPRPGGELRDVGTKREKKKKKNKEQLRRNQQVKIFKKKNKNKENTHNAD